MNLVAPATQGTEEETPPSLFVDAIKQHLSVIAEMQRVRPFPPGILNSFATLQLTYGREYDTDARTFEGRRMQAKMCYRNAGTLALDDPSLTYVEGFTTVSGIPIEHAWCINQAGTVIEPTLSHRSGSGGYFGIPLRTSFLRSELLRREVWGVLDMNIELLRMSPDEIVKRVVDKS